MTKTWQKAEKENKNHNGVKLADVSTKQIQL